MTWWVHDYIEAGLYIDLVSWIFWLLFSITLHELAHGWAALWQGDDTPVRLDHMTANPLVHMGPQSLIVFAICGIAWGQMPVNPSRFRDGRRGDLYVSAAGPAMNLLIAIVCAVSLVLWLKLVPDGRAQSYGAVVLFTGIRLNLLLAVLNLMPLPPLDGSTILASLSRRARELFSHPQAAFIGTAIYVGVIFMTPIGAAMWRFTDRITYNVVDSLGKPLDNPSLFEALYLHRIHDLAGLPDSEN